MSSSSRPLSCSLAPETLQHCSAAPSPYFSAPSTLSTSPHSAHFSSSPSPSLSSSCSSSSSFSFSSNSNSNSANFGAEYYSNHQQNLNQNQNQNLQHLSMMAATVDGNSSSMMKLYNSNPKIESGFEASWNGNNTSSLYGSAKVPAYQQQQQPQQQLDQINFLVRKECCNEIDQAVKELGISADPFNWSISDVQKWLLWMQRWAQLPTLKLEHFAMDGMSLCALSEEDFRQRVPHGEKLYAKLEIWRMAINYFGATEVLFDSLFGGGDGLSQEDTSGHSSMTNNFSGQYCASPYSTSSTTTDASSLYSGSSPISPEGYGVSGGSSSSGCGSLPTYAESMYGGLCSSGHSIASSPASPASSSHSSVNSCSPYGQPQQQQQQQNYGYGQSSMMAAPQQQQQYGKATMGSLSMNSDFSTNMSNSAAMISAMSAVGTQQQQQQRMAPTSDYGSDAIPSDDDDMSDDGKCFLDYHHQQHHRMTLQQQQQQLMHFQQQQMQSSTGRALPTGHPLPQIKVESRSDYSPSTSPVYHQHHQHGLQHHQQHLMQQQQQYGHSRPAVHHQHHQYSSHSISVVSKGELPPVSISSSIAVPSSASAAAPVASAPVAPPVRTSSSHIHLWQFLKELLSGPHQYGSSIRWLDRSKGVFKIEDSVSVAKLWGARKNRPAMNYDKLSRSIRQYYKKGIMKKTERSQRLVYQFCANYAL